MDDSSSSSSSSSRDILLRLFNEIILWKKYTISDKFKFHWNWYHLSVVCSYVSTFHIPSDFLLAINYDNLFGDSVCHSLPASCIKCAKIVASFSQELRPFFHVRTPHQLVEGEHNLKENELLAAFVDFLLRLLRHDTDFTDRLKDQIHVLQKDLRFLVTVVGDTVLVDDEEEAVQNLLEEFKAVVNEAGGLVHSLFFSAVPVFAAMEEEFGVVLKGIGLLSDNVIKFLDVLPSISKACVTPNTSSVDSLVIVDSLVYHLTDLINEEDSVIADVKDQFKYLHGNLIFSLFCIRDIGGACTSAIGELKEPVMRMGDVACEAEYLIHSYLVGDAPLLYFTIRLSHVIDRIELIMTGLREIKKIYGVGAFDHVAKSFSVQPSLQAKPMSEVEVDAITVGFADKEEDILDLVARGTNHLQIVSIFGMPGLGKTTLAKKVYNHPLIQYRFDKSVWCVVSQTYHMIGLLIDILDKLTSKQDKDRILNSELKESLVLRIYKILKGRRYLIIMDDIWSTNVWDDLRRCFPDDENGSRIVFTSRNKDLAPPNSIIYALPSLSNDQCWELLEKKVFHNKPCPSQLIQIGKQIAVNCFGLPLAVVVIAGILSNMDKEKTTWTKVRRNLASFMYSDQNNSLMQMLELSYEHLPDHLKPCFLYFGVQTSTEISVRKLMRLWIAEGFIHKEWRKSLEKVAEEYLSDLINTSLVMVSKRRSDGGVKACALHDLLRDMCLKRCKEENFLKLVNQSIYVKGRRILSLTRNLVNSFGQHLRSFHGYYPSESPCPSESPFYVINMKLLRVLNFHSKTDPPSLIGTEFLIQLRYLVVRDFPASLGSLVNLEFLIVCKSTAIPTVMLKMKKLRYVKFMELASFEEDCNSSQTNNLEFVSNIGIMSLKDEEMLKCSSHLRTLKCTCRPILEEHGVYRYPDYSFLTHLESLNVTALYGYDHEISEIKLPMNIKKLTLSGLHLPWGKMSIIGTLPKLKVLKLGNDAFVGNTWETRDGEFVQLIFLKLETNHLVEWNVASSQHFPNLQNLVLHYCRHLQEIPSQVGEVGALQSIELKSCPQVVEESALSIQQEQQDMGNEELRVIIRRF